MASTISSGLTDPPVTNGRTIPAVVIPATVAEPTQNRKIVAISQPRNNGDREDWLSISPIYLLTPLSTSTCFNAPAPAIRSIIIVIVVTE